MRIYVGATVGWMGIVNRHTSVSLLYSSQPRTPPPSLLFTNGEEPVDNANPSFAGRACYHSDFSYLEVVYMFLVVEAFLLFVCICRTHSGRQGFGVQSLEEHDRGAV